LHEVSWLFRAEKYNEYTFLKESLGSWFSLLDGQILLPYKEEASLRRFFVVTEI
jgi:hypothetical protein